MGSTYTLFKHQQDAEPLLTRGSAILWWDMQTGKTRATLHAFDRLWQSGGPRRLIVIAPAYARATWVNEMEEMGLGLPVSNLYGITKRKIVGDLVDPFADPKLPSVVLASWDVVGSWLGPLLKQAHLSALVLDESHEHATNPATKRYKAVSRLALASNRTWELTGTIYRKSALDIFWQGKLVGGFRGLKAIEYGEKYCLKRFNPFRGKSGGYEYRGLRPGIEERLVELLPNLSRVRESEAFDVPLVRRIAQYVDLGPGYTGGDNEANLERARSALIPIKIQRTLEFLNDLSDRPVVVFGWHQEFVEKLAASIPGAEFVTGNTPAIRRADIQRRFAAGRIPVLVANLRAFGLSVSLARAHHIVFGEIHWSETDHRQAEGRIHGPSQVHDRLHFTYLLVKNSVDEFVWRVKLDKGKAIDRLDAAVGPVLTPTALGV
jgi:hypothetical protein